MASIDDAIQAFSHFKAYIGDAPTNETEYKALKVCPPNDAVWDTEKAAAPTWAEIQAKLKELNDAEAKAKEDKLSAYRKLSMTDDEINALDPTLLE